MSDTSLPAAEQPRPAVTEVPEHLQNGTHGPRSYINVESKYGGAAQIKISAYRHRSDPDSTVHLILCCGAIDVELRHLKPVDARRIADALNRAAADADQQMAEFAAAMQAAGGAA